MEVQKKINNESQDNITEDNIEVIKEEGLLEVSSQAAKNISTSYFNPIVWAQMKGMAATFLQSKALPKHLDSLPKIIIQMQTGIEMGMKPMESIQSLYIVNGSINIWGKATVKVLRKHGWAIKYVSEDDSHCTAKVSKKETGEVYQDTFKYQDAVDSGFTVDIYGKEKIGWKKGVNRTMKMRYNVLSKIIKSYIPEVLEGVAEIQEVYEDFQILRGETKPENKGGKVKNVKVATPKEQSEKIKEFLKAQ
jgi:hypothetical protein